MSEKPENKLVSTSLIRASNGGVFKKVDDMYVCIACKNNRILCCGCGGMSIMYPNMFGSCQPIDCLNCIWGSSPNETWEYPVSEDDTYAGTEYIAPKISSAVPATENFLKVEEWKKVAEDKITALESYDYDQE